MNNNSQAMAAMHARLQRVESDTSDVREKYAELSREQGVQGATLSAAVGDIAEIKSDVRWLRTELAKLLGVYAVVSAAVYTAAQYFIGHH
jgi:hypothetical protein